MGMEWLTNGRNKDGAINALNTHRCAKTRESYFAVICIRQSRNDDEKPCTSEMEF